MMGSGLSGGFVPSELSCARGCTTSRDAQVYANACWSSQPIQCRTPAPARSANITPAVFRIPDHALALALKTQEEGFQPGGGPGWKIQIGRASCRERV